MDDAKKLILSIFILDQRQEKQSCYCPYCNSTHFEYTDIKESQQVNFTRLEYILIPYKKLLIGFQKRKVIMKILVLTPDLSLLI